MKKVIAIVLGDNDFPLYDLIRERTASALYLGAWGKIADNVEAREECVSAIVFAVRNFLKNGEKDIVFSCHRDDLADIRQALGDCELQVFGRVDAK